MEIKAGFSCKAKVETEGDKKIAKFPIPIEFQGHTFAIEYNIAGREIAKGGPYRIEYVLSSDFLIYRHDVDKINLEQGYSNLKFGGKMENLKDISLSYMPLKTGQKKKATLTFGLDELRIQRLIIEMPEENIDSALRFSGKFINEILDALSFRKAVPIQIRKIEIFHSPSNELLRSYVTIPYKKDEIVEGSDLEFAVKVPESLKPLLRLYREAINSSSPFHRCLYLYRTHEGLLKIQQKNTTAIKAQGKDPKRERLSVPDYELTRKYFPEFIGKKIGAFLDYIRKEFRLNLTHTIFDEDEKMQLEPGNIGIIHKIDLANALLERIIYQAVSSELEFMLKNELK